MKSLLHSRKPLFHALTETWLYSSHQQAEYEVEGYTFFKHDRNRVKHKGKRASGGVGVYIRDDIATTAEKTLTFSNGFADGLVVTVKSIGLEIIVIYRSEPEDRSTADTTFSPLLTKIRS